MLSFKYRFRLLMNSTPSSSFSFSSTIFRKNWPTLAIYRTPSRLNRMNGQPKSSFLHPPRFFHIFISPKKEFAEVPQHFFENFKGEIPRRVFFFDPVDTKIGIIFDSSSGNGYFTHGLYNILSHYYLHRGAWLRLMYLGRAEFVMKVHNIYMQEVKYPTPAKDIDFAIQYLPEDIKNDTDSKE